MMYQLLTHHKQKLTKRVDTFFELEDPDAELADLLSEVATKKPVLFI